MTPRLLSPTAARRVFLTLTWTRWFPVGLVIGIMTLWPLERGLSVAQTLSATAATGLVVFALELPTSGFADALGRRPVFVAAAVVNVAAGVMFLLARSFWGFVAAAALSGVFRALDSGPLEAWYVDTVHATEPDADIHGALSAQATLLGLGIASGAALSGGLIWWHPISSRPAMLLPLFLWVVLGVVHLAVVLLILREPVTTPAPSPSGTSPASGLRRAAASTREAPVVVRDGLRMLRGNAVLRGIVLVEVFWSVGMVVFETFQPIRLAELVGGETEAGALMGPVAAAAWGVFAAGSAAAGLASRRIGVTRTAVLARVLNGCGAVVMGLVAGPAALIAAYLFTYGLHGTGGPMHNALLHREAQARNRATVLSMNSMVAFASFSVAAPLLGLLSESTSTQVAMVAAGAISIAGAPLYRAARRRERELDDEVALREPVR